MNEEKEALDSDGPRFYMNTKRFLEFQTSHIAKALMMDLMMVVYMQTQSAFVFDEQALADQINTVFPERPEPWTVDMIRRHRDEVATYFTILPDGRWAPSPEFFSMNDGNAEMLGRGH